jgi:predicted small lipoprotein YifL
MQTIKAILIILIFTALLGACGNKGPLYLPEEKPVVEQESTAEADTDTDTDTDTDKKDKEKKDKETKESF